MLNATAVAAPVRSLEQRMDALKHANAVRCYRAALKQDIRAGVGARSAMDVVADPLPLEETWKVFDLVRQMPALGRVKTEKVLRRESISPSKTVGGLSDRQRAALCRALWALPSVRRGMVAA